MGKRRKQERGGAMGTIRAEKAKPVGKGRGAMENEMPTQVLEGPPSYYMNLLTSQHY